jgi:hypothetical protein
VTPWILGPVPDPDLPSLVAGAGAFAFPSAQAGFGLAAMEALAAGVPLVASDLPVLREVFAGAAVLAADPPALAAGLHDALTRPDPARAAAGRALAARYLGRRGCGAPRAVPGVHRRGCSRPVARFRLWPLSLMGPQGDGRYGCRSGRVRRAGS